MTRIARAPMWPRVTPPSAPVEVAAPSASHRGRRVAQVLFFGTVVWIILSFSVQVLGDGLFRHADPKTAAECRVAIDALEAKLARASLADRPAGELPAVNAFRNALSADGARAWDLEAFALVKACPEAESDLAYSVARLRATEEAMTRVDAVDAAAARRAYEHAKKTIDDARPR